MKNYRQGDVYILSKQFPKGNSQNVKSKVLALGEVTGHSHVLKAIRQYGYEKMLEDIDHKVIDTHSVVSSNGKLLKYEVIEVNLQDETDNIPARFVKVQCWTTEKSTLLRVDPRDTQTKDCMGAIAWTAGMNKEEYLMQTET